VCETPNNQSRPLQGTYTDLAQKKSAGDSSLNGWAFDVLTDRDLTRHAVCVGIFLRDILDPQTGFASPSIRAIATATGLSRCSAERAVRALVAMSHLRVIAGGGGPNNCKLYRLSGEARRDE
jgi:hypothetical protein